MTPIDRRRFAATLAALGLSSTPAMFADAKAEPEVLQLSRNGWMPNNERLPVLLYRSAIQAGGRDPAAVFEQAFTRNGWPPQWRNGVTTFTTTTRPRTRCWVLWRARRG